MIPIWFGRWAVNPLVITIGGSIPSVLSFGYSRKFILFLVNLIQYLGFRL